MTLRLSVIVPFGPEETEGDVLLGELRAMPADVEVILVRSGAASRTANEPSVREVRSLPGRARQMNVGAQAARGRWLWFVHADSQLHQSTLDALLAFLARNEDALGYFDLRYRADGPRLAQLNAYCANLRARWLGLPFGDQGLVLPAEWFARLGRYDENARYGEDHLLVWRAHAAGLPVRRVGAPLATSARKYAEYGWWRVTRRHLHLTAYQAWPQWWKLRGARFLRVQSDGHDSQTR